MLEKDQINKIKEATEEFFEKMTVAVSDIKIGTSSIEEDKNVIDMDIEINEPQILIGQGGQTLFEIQRLLRVVLNRKLSTLPGQRPFYLNLDIDGYKKKKTEYLKDLAKNLADQVSLDKEEKALLPMSSYERRIIHAELSGRTDVSTESQGDGFDRHIVIKPK
jgi:spoIIIJ-associated protein